MSPIRSRPSRAALIVGAALALAACQKKKSENKSAGEPKPVPAASADAAATASGAIEACRAAADRYVKDPETGPAFLAGCAPMVGDPSCRGALEAAAASPGVEAGMAAIETCKTAYCPRYDLAVLCESKAPPTVKMARAQFPPLLAEVLQGEHGAALGTLDSAAYLLIKPLLPTQRKVYIRAKAAGARVTLAIGEDGWVGCKTGRTVTIDPGADLRKVGGPLLGPLAQIGSGAEPALMEVVVDPDPDPRVKEVATAAARFLAGRGMEVVSCFNKRANCPDVKTCP